MSAGGRVMRAGGGGRRIGRDQVVVSCRVLLLVAASLVVASACSAGTYALPDRGDDGVQAKETELASVLSGSGDGVTCEVRLLGESEGAAFVWAECVDGKGSGVSVPLRIEGGQVEGPGDGSQFSGDVRRLFPSGLAKLILGNPDRLRP